jgi:UDPglucose--hexose-1-phosphate uridylyltransferase
MTNNEIRKDYLLNRWVVIAKDRKKRPVDFVKNKLTEKQGVCPFCPNNEHMTPPSVLTYLVSDRGLKKVKDRKDLFHKNWTVRVVPNAYPAFSPPSEETLLTETAVLKNAVGHHEVVIESPCHDEHPGTARVSQLVHVINAYFDRLTAISRNSYVKHVTIFRNHGREAGASLSHAHSQLIATPFIPRILEEELAASKNFWTQNHECLLCDVLEKENDGPRFIWENPSFVVFTPLASVNPFEFWVLPKCHQSNILAMSGRETQDLAEVMRICLGALRSLLNDPPYNFGFHTLLKDDVEDCYHWHLEIYPRLTIWAGFEKSTGMFINTVSPEDAAKELRKAVKAEQNFLR